MRICREAQAEIPIPLFAPDKSAWPRGESAWPRGAAFELFLGFRPSWPIYHAWLRTRFRLSSIASGMLNITDPPTARSVVMCMLHTMLHLNITRNLAVCNSHWGTVHAIDVLRPWRVAVDNPISRRSYRPACQWVQAQGVRSRDRGKYRLYFPQTLTGPEEDGGGATAEQHTCSIGAVLI